MGLCKVWVTVLTPRVMTEKEEEAGTIGGTEPRGLELYEAGSLLPSCPQGPAFSPASYLRLWVLGDEPFLVLRVPHALSLLGPCVL